MIRYTIFALILLTSNALIAQDWNIIIEVTILDDEKNLSGVEINVYRDGVFVETIMSDNDGRADLYLKPGCFYEVGFGGNNNYILKKLQLDTEDTSSEDLNEDIYFPAEIDIFKKIEGMDYSILEKPIAKLKYNSSINAFDIVTD